MSQSGSGNLALTHLPQRGFTESRLIIGELRSSPTGLGPKSPTLSAIRSQCEQADRVRWIEVASVPGDFASVDALVCSHDPGPVFFQEVQKRRFDAGLPGQWPVLGIGPFSFDGSPPKSSGFGTLQTTVLSTAEDLLDKAGTYRQNRKSQSASALRATLLAIGVLAFVFAGSLRLLLVGEDRFETILKELAQTDSTKVERRLEYSPVRLKHQIDLLGEIAEHPKWKDLSPGEKDHLLSRKRELERYLPWQEEILHLPTPADLFSMADIEAAIRKTGLLVDQADGSWKGMEPFKKARETLLQISRLEGDARKRIDSLREELQNAVDLASWEPPAPKEIADWQKKASDLLSVKIPPAEPDVEKLLEVAEAKAGWERSLEQIRAQKGWLELLGLQGKNPAGMDLLLAGNKPRPEVLIWRDKAGLFPGAFRDRVAQNARAVEAKWIPLGINALDRIWPGRNPTGGIPTEVVNQTAADPAFQEIRKWITALRILQTPSDRPLPPTESLDPWSEVERFANNLPKEISPTRIVVEGPLKGVPNLGQKQRLQLVSGAREWVLDKSVCDEFPGKGTFTLTFDFVDKKPIALVGPWTARLAGEKVQILWDDPPSPLWAPWKTLQLSGDADPVDPTGKDIWHFRLSPPLPVIPALLAARP